MARVTSLPPTPACRSTSFNELEILGCLVENSPSPSRSFKMAVFMLKLLALLFNLARVWCTANCRWSSVSRKALNDRGRGDQMMYLILQPSYLR